MARKRYSQRKRRRSPWGRLRKPLAVLLAAAAVVAALTLFFRVGSVEVAGCSRYTPEEVVAASGVERGDNLILLDRYRAAQRICRELPYVSEVRLTQDFPDTLVIEVTETRAAAAIQGDGAWWLLSDGGKLLEMTDDAGAADSLRILGTRAVEPAEGAALALPEDCPLTADRLCELLAGMTERGMLGRADSLDLSDSGTLILNYDGRFRVEMFYDADLAYKLDCLNGVVDRLEPNETGTIRMTMDDDKEIRFIPDAE